MPLIQGLRDPTPGALRTGGFLLFPLVVLTTLAVYWVGLSGPFLFDDFLNLASVEVWLRDGLSLTELLREAPGGPSGRPVSVLSFALSAWLGGHVPFAYKLGNLLLHLGCGLTVLMFAKQVFAIEAGSLATPSAARASWLLAALVASLWLLHPIHVSTVLYAVQRMAQLSALFMVLGLYAWMRFRSSEISSRVRGRWLMCWGASLILASLSKENGVLLVPITAALELCLLRGPRPWAARLVIALTVLGLAAAVLVLAVRPDWLMGGYAVREFTLWERLWMQPLILFDYIAKLLFPALGSFALYEDQWRPGPHIWGDPAHVVAVIALIGLVSFALGMRRRFPVAAFGMWLFLLGHAMESSLIPLELYFEHRNYLPSIGLGLCLVDLCARPLASPSARAVGRPVVVAGLVVVLLFVLASQTLRLSLRWSGTQSLLLHNIEAVPESARARLDLALWLESQRRLTHAKAVLVPLLDSPSPSAKRQAIAFSEALACVSGGGDPQALARAGGVAAPVISAGDATALRLLAARLDPGRACPSFDLGEVGELGVRWLELATDPETGRNRQLLRLQSAIAFFMAGDRTRAVSVLSPAWASGTAPNAVGSLMFELHLTASEYEAARDVLDRLHLGNRRSSARVKQQLEGLGRRLIEEKSRHASETSAPSQRAE